MPDPPSGERRLGELADAYEGAEETVRAAVAAAPAGDRARLTLEAIAALVALRRLDARRAIADAYLAANAGGAARAVGDLAGSLAVKLDRGARYAAGRTRKAIARATVDNALELADDAVTADIDARGRRWALGPYAAMNTATIGRAASSRGVVDSVGAGGRFQVDVGECAYCSELFAGELVAGVDPTPPGHPSCTCVAIPL